MRKILPNERFNKSINPLELGFFAERNLYHHILPRILMLLDRQSWARAARVCSFWYDTANSPAVLHAVGISRRWIANQCQNTSDIFFGFDSTERTQFIRFLLDRAISSENKINFLEQIINSLVINSSKKSATVAQFLRKLSSFIRACEPRAQLSYKEEMNKEILEFYVCRFLKEQTLKSAVSTGTNTIGYVLDKSYLPIASLFCFFMYKEKFSPVSSYFLLAGLLMMTTMYVAQAARGPYNYFREEYRHGRSDREIDEQLRLEEERESKKSHSPK